MLVLASAFFLFFFFSFKLHFCRAGSSAARTRQQTKFPLDKHKKSDIIKITKAEIRDMGFDKSFSENGAFWCECRITKSYLTTL